MNNHTLAVISNLKAVKISKNKFLLTKKFIDGVNKYKEYWQGRIVVFVEEVFTPSNNLDNEIIDRNEISFEIEIVDFDYIHENIKFTNASAVLASVGYRQNHISTLCKIYGIFCFYTTEYSLKTRRQIIDIVHHNFAIKVKKYIWEILQEIKQRKAIVMAQGIQCNGVPTYNEYYSINTNSILYFDSRIRENMLVIDTVLNTRTSQCLNSSSLRLLFSGRLIKMKGADHLIPIAQKLHQLGIKFEFFICGDGDLKQVMQEQISQSGLSNLVKMKGIMKFDSELIPFIQKNIDIFVCCHRQGDPSCTYLEIMSCGVPIVGYSNEALVGVVKHSRSGWLIKMNRLDLLARKIAWLSENKMIIVKESYKSLNFGKIHTFEKTFARRIDHIKESLTTSISN